MTQEDKKLLLKDLCARLPYGVKVQVYYEDIAGSGYFDETVWIIDNDEPFHVNDSWIENIKTYLRPISSMTEEEVDNLFKILDINEDLATEWLKVNDIGIIRLFTQQGKDFYEIAEAMDYLNSIHIDYRGLIEKSLAIDVTKENNPYKE